MIIIPAIDIIGGKCVRLTEGAYDNISDYNIDPLEQATEFEQAGITHLHLVDLDGARARSMVNWPTIERILKSTNLTVDVSGGITSLDDLERILKYSKAKVTIGSLAAREPEKFMEFIEHFGADRIILGADIKGDKIAINGWEEMTELTYLDFIKRYQILGIQNVMCTDISKDGMMMGPAVDLYKDIINEVADIKLIASGGVRSVKDLEDLKIIGCSAAIVGKAIYEGAISIQELANFN